MSQSLASVALLVKDYDEAIEFYTQTLSFNLIEDSHLSPQKRWVVIAPNGPGSCSIVLAKAASDKQQTRVGDQTGGRVFLFLHTDDIWRDYQELQSKGVNFVRAPADQNYGTVAVFEDLYGNLWDLIQPASITTDC